MELTFVKTQKKYLRKHKKKEEKIRKTIYYLNNKKSIKTSFYYSQKNGFKNTKNKNTPPSSNKLFVFFVFKNKK